MLLPVLRTALRRCPEQNIVDSVGIEWWIEINEIDAFILDALPKHIKIIAEI